MNQKNKLTPVFNVENKCCRKANSDGINLPDCHLCYACCGNCRYYSSHSDTKGLGWCGLHNTYTEGGDDCGSWEE